jgi:hypothetical protein
MVEIPCLACDKVLELPQFINVDNYDGQLVCSKCKALLHVKFVKGKLLRYKIIERLRKGEPVKIVVVHDQEPGQPFKKNRREGK